MPPDAALGAAPEVRGLLRVGVVSAAPVAVGPAGEDLVAAIERRCGELCERHRGTPPSRIAGLAPARELYRAFGIDPTRMRPSSEALLRRSLRGLPFPRVSSAVDVGNLCSITFLLPLGLYDADRIQGAVTLRRGAAGESYAGIRKDRVNLEGRPVLADAEGPFGNPTSDSFRTRVTRGTRSLLMVIFAPRSAPDAELRGHVTTACELIERHLGGRASGAVPW